MKTKNRFKTAKEIREEKIEKLKELLAKGYDDNDILSIHLGLSITTVWKYRKMLDGKNFSARHIEISIYQGKHHRFSRQWFDEQARKAPQDSRKCVQCI